MNLQYCERAETTPEPYNITIENVKNINENVTEYSMMYKTDKKKPAEKSPKTRNHIANVVLISPYDKIPY